MVDLTLFDFEDFVALGAAGSVEGEFIAFLFTHQCGAERRVVRNFALKHVGLFSADNSVGALVFAGTLTGALHDDDRTHTYRVGLRTLNDLCVLEDRLKFADALLNSALHFAGLLILGIFRKVAKRASIFKLLGYLAAARGAQLVEFFG